MCRAALGDTLRGTTAQARGTLRREAPGGAVLLNHQLRGSYGKREDLVWFSAVSFSLFGHVPQSLLGCQSDSFYDW